MIDLLYKGQFENLRRPRCSSLNNCGPVVMIYDLIRSNCTRSLHELDFQRVHNYPILRLFIPKRGTTKCKLTSQSSQWKPSSFLEEVKTVLVQLQNVIKRMQRFKWVASKQKFLARINLSIAYLSFQLASI
jgi:hypothetical protein